MRCLLLDMFCEVGSIVMKKRTYREPDPVILRLRPEDFSKLSDREPNPIILQFRSDDFPEAPDPEHTPDHPRDGFETQAEEFWAGRSHAMRLSARVAA